MTKIIDEDVIRNKPVSDAYRDGWERCFGEAPHAEPTDKCTDAIECRITTYLWHCETCAALVSDPENHRYHAIIKLTADTSINEK